MILPRTLYVPRLPTWICSSMIWVMMMFSFTAHANPKIAITELQVADGVEFNNAGFVAASKLTTGLLKTRGWTVISRDQMASIMREQGFQSSGLVDAGQAVSLGEIAGVDYILVGRVDRASTSSKTASAVIVATHTTVATVELSLQVIDVHSGAIVAAVEGVGEATSKSAAVGGMGGGTGVDADSILSDAFDKAVHNAVVALVDQTGRGDPPAPLIESGRKKKRR